MLTDEEMLKIAEHFTRFSVKPHIEPMIYSDHIIKKPYGNIYHYDSRKYILTGDFNYSLAGKGPFLVEKETGRVVPFGTARSLEDSLEAYENDTLMPCLTRYWYPEDERFDYK